MLAAVILGALGFEYFCGVWACIGWLSGVCFMDMAVPLALRRSRYSVSEEDAD